MADCSTVLRGPSRTAERDRAVPFLPLALAEGWTVRKFSSEADISVNLASALLRGASDRQKANTDTEVSDGISRALEMATLVRDTQIGQAQRIEALVEGVLCDLEAKAERGDLSIPDLKTLTDLREKHWQHLKDMAGINVAEKIVVSRAKGEAAGRGFTEALLDSTAIEFGDGVFPIATARPPSPARRE